MKKMFKNEDYRLILNTLLRSGDIRSLVVLIITYTGCRPNEALNLIDSSIEINDDVASIYIVASKRSDSRLVRMPDHLLARIKDLKKTLREIGKPLSEVFGNFSMSFSANYKIIWRYFNALQVEIYGEQRYTLKSFRHTLASNALKSGIDIVEVQSMLGHKRLSSTMFYLAEYKRGIALNKVHGIVDSVLV